MMAKYSCKVCGSTNMDFAFKATDLNRQKSGDIFSYFRCNDCNSFSIQPIPQNVGIYYAGDYPAYQAKHDSRVEENYLLLERQKISILKQFVGDGNLVEIGPATGRFLKEANASGYKVLGLELDQQCVDYIQKTLKIDVKQTDDPSIELLSMNHSVDVIVAWHVIEHLTDLKKLISSAKKALKNSNGVIIFSAPNPNSWSFKVFKKYWVHLDAPRHLSLIPIETLDLLMGSEGFSRVGVVFDDLTGIQLNKMGWQSSCQNLSNNKFIKKYPLRIIGKMLSLTMNVFDQFPGRGAAYTAVYSVDLKK